MTTEESIGSTTGKTIEEKIEQTVEKLNEAGLPTWAIVSIFIGMIREICLFSQIKTPFPRNYYLLLYYIPTSFGTRKYEGSLRLVKTL